MVLPGGPEIPLPQTALERRRAAEQPIHRIRQRLRRANFPGPDPLTCHASQPEADFLFQKIAAQPEESAEFAVHFLRCPPEVHGQQHQPPLGLHRFPENQLAGFGREFPMDLVQAIPGTIQPQFVVFRIPAAEFGTPGPGQKPFQLRQLPQGKRPGPNQHPGIFPFPHRKPEEPQIIVNPCPLRLHQQSAAVVRGQRHIGGPAPDLPGGQPGDPQLPPERRHRHPAPARQPDFRPGPQGHRRRRLGLQPEGHHPRQAQHQAEPGKEQQHLQDQPGKPLLVAQVKNHTDAQGRHIKHSSCGHISAIWEQGPAPAAPAVPPRRTYPYPRPWRTAPAGGQRYVQTLPEHPREPHNPCPGAVPQPLP